MPRPRCEDHDYVIDLRTAKDIAAPRSDMPPDHCYLHECSTCEDQRWAPTHRLGQPIFPVIESWPAATNH